MIHKLFLHPVQKKLIMSIIDHFQLSAGVSTPILSTTNQPLGYVSSTWFLDLINYCQKYHIKLQFQIHYVSQFKEQTINNIMDELIQTKLKETQLRRINVCRMFLKLTHVSDIYQPNGVDINTDFLAYQTHFLIQRSIGRFKRSHPLQLGSYGIKLFKKRLVYKIIIRMDVSKCHQRTIGRLSLNF